jgi:CubicO group peptidase (beta-lactamase class C family)
MRVTLKLASAGRTRPPSTRLPNMRPQRMALLALACGLALSDAGSAAGQAATPALFPAASWQSVPPASQSAACNIALSKAGDYLRTLDTTALLAVRDGRALFSYGDVAVPNILFSARKSLLSMMYGKYVANGTIALDSTLAELDIDDIGGLLPVERGARLRQLLQSRSGVYHAAANGGDDHAAAPARGSQPPGSYFLYNNWDFNAAGTAFEKLTGRSLYQTFADDLAGPLQLEDFDLARQRRSGDAKQSRHLAYHFYLSTRDMARLGYLMLQQGRWRDRQLIPADWVAQMVGVDTPSADMHPPHVARRRFGYGYMWWLLEEPASSPLHGAYMAWGIHGQYILVMPARGMVVAHQRQVPVAGNWNLSWVQPRDFLRAASMLAEAPCD